MCLPGWKCIHSEPDPISGFFGADGSDRCQATCGSCPGNQFCAKEGKVGETPPLDIAIQPTEAIAGQPTKLTASANGVTLTSCRWELYDSGAPAEPSSAVEVTRTFDEAGTFKAQIEVKCQPSGSACAIGFCCADSPLVCLPSPSGNVCRVPNDPTGTIEGPEASRRALVALRNDGEAPATLSTSRTVQATFECKADGSITCCAPYLCKPSGSTRWSKRRARASPCDPITDRT